MIAATLRGPRLVEVVEYPDPVLLDAGDAIVRVARAAICGTDLHAYRGELVGFRPDNVFGHEFVGMVESVGDAVGRFAPGDRVVASDVIACGQCWWCRRADHYQCDHVSLFGYGDVVGPYVPGGQAELVRVPFADTVLGPIPDGIADEKAVFVGDVLATGWTAGVEGAVGAGDVVAIVGCGPVGLCSALASRALRAATVVAVDSNRARRRVAEQLGAVAVTPNAAAEAVLDLTDGRGADVVIEAVGTSASLRASLSLVRARGVVVAVGAHHDPDFRLNTAEAFAKELSLRFAIGDPIRFRDELFALIGAGLLDPTPIVSHRLSLEDAADGYALFDRQEAVKVLLVPPHASGSHPLKSHAPESHAMEETG